MLRFGKIHIEHICNPYIKSKKGQSVLYAKVATCDIQQLFRKLEVLPLFHLVKYKTAIFMYKVFYNLVPANILSHFTHISNVYSTRQHENLYVHYARTKHKQMCVEHMGVNIWNSIEIETRNCKDLKLFKVKYKKVF